MTGGTTGRRNAVGEGGADMDGPSPVWRHLFDDQWFRTPRSGLDQVPASNAAASSSKPLHDSLVPVGEQLNQHRTGASVIQRLECLDRAQLAEALQLDDTSRQIWDDIGTASNQFELGLFPRAERSFSCAISATTLSATSSSLDREVTDGE